MYRPFLLPFTPALPPAPRRRTSSGSATKLELAAGYCRQGHKLTERNTFYRNGRPGCKICRSNPR